MIGNRRKYSVQGYGIRKLGPMEFSDRECLQRLQRAAVLQILSASLVFLAWGGLFSAAWLQVGWDAIQIFAVVGLCLGVSAGLIDMLCIFQKKGISTVILLAGFFLIPLLLVAWLLDLASRRIDGKDVLPALLVPSRIERVEFDADSAKYTISLRSGLTYSLSRCEREFRLDQALEEGSSVSRHGSLGQLALAIV